MAVDPNVMESTGTRATEVCPTCGLAHTLGIPAHAPHPHAGPARWYAWPTDDGRIDTCLDVEVDCRLSRSEVIGLLANRLRAKLDRPDPEMESRPGPGGCVAVPTGRTVLERHVSLASMIVSSDGQVHGPGHVRAAGPTTSLRRLIEASLDALNRPGRV